MKDKRKAISLVVLLAIAIAGFFLVERSILASSLNSSVTVGAATPTVSSVTITPSAPIVLTANTTTPINVTAIIADNNGCAALDNGTRTIELYRTSLAATCAASNLNCYTATVFTATSSCSGGTSENVTTTFNVYYFADATDASSSHSTDSWQATMSVTSNAGTTSTASSATTSLQTLTALNVTEAAINYGSLSASSTSPSSQTTTISNVGNSTTTLQLSGTAFVAGSNNFATSSQHYATSSSFTYGTGDNTLQQSATTFTNFILATPTTTTAVSNFVYWKLNVPAGTATGTYTATTTFSSLWHS